MFKKGNYVQTEDGYVGEIIVEIESYKGERRYLVWIEKTKSKVGYPEDDLEPAKRWQGLEEGEKVICGDDYDGYKAQTVIKRTGDIVLLSDSEVDYLAIGWHTLKELEQDNEWHLDTLELREKIGWGTKEQEEEEEQEEKIEKIVSETIMMWNNYEHNYPTIQAIRMAIRKALNEYLTN